MKNKPRHTKPNPTHPNFHLRSTAPNIDIKSILLEAKIQAKYINDGCEPFNNYLRLMDGYVALPLMPASPFTSSGMQLGTSDWSAFVSRCAELPRPVVAANKNTLEKLDISLRNHVILNSDAQSDYRILIYDIMLQVYNVADIIAIPSDTLVEYMLKTEIIGNGHTFQSGLTQILESEIK